MRQILVFLISSFIILAYHPLSSGEALLQTTIHAIPKNNSHSPVNHIQPGTLMQLQATVKNVGSALSKQGTLRIQFAFPKPLDVNENSILFKTELADLPSIHPGEEISISFKKAHQWPTLFNFIRDDWAMREYQAVAVIDGPAQIVGALTVAFSAYYYEGARMNKPVKVSSRYTDHY